MTSFVFPTLQGLTFDVVRTPVWRTEKQRAISGKRSTMAYQQYPLIHFELTFSILRDDLVTSDVKALVGLFNACQGSYDTFLFTDPDFNAVTSEQFGVTDGTTLTFQTVAAYQNPGGPGYGEIIQNLNGPFTFRINRYGTLLESPTGASRTQYCLQSQNFSNASWGKANLTAGVAAQLAPDGTATAYVLNDSTVSSVNHDLTQGFAALAAGTYAGSVFIWGGATEAQYIWIYLQDGTNSDTAYAIFDKNAGTVVTSATSGATWSGVVATIQQAGSVSGSFWYRLTLTAAKSTANAVNFFVRPSSSSVSPTYAGAVGVAAAVVWGAQFENNAYPSMYIPTTTAAVTQQDWVGISATLQISINSANFGAISGIKLLWTGSWYYRCAFDNDQLDLVKFMNKWWSLKKLPITSVKL
jgi:hypothetical protein